MLWPLYGRAAEARRPGGVFRDENAVRIENGIAYDFKRSFGRPDLGHAIRAVAFDRELREWLCRHPNGQVVALGEGLETQFYRLDNGLLRWLSVDLPEAIQIRSHFIPDSARHKNVAGSALDLGWLEHLEPNRPVFITAAGLLMYFQPYEVRRLITGIAEAIPNAEIMFDVLPHWLSRKTVKGWNLTRHYRPPPMPWALNRNEVQSIREWHPNIAEVEQVRFPRGRGFAFRFLYPLILKLPWLKNKAPSLLHVYCRAVQSAKTKDAPPNQTSRKPSSTGA